MLVGYFNYLANVVRGRYAEANCYLFVCNLSNLLKKILDTRVHVCTGASNSNYTYLRNGIRGVIMR